MGVPSENTCVLYQPKSNGKGTLHVLNSLKLILFSLFTLKLQLYSDFFFVLPSYKNTQYEHALLLFKVVQPESMTPMAK